MTNNQSRQPAGVPVGGQYAATSHSEPGVSLPKSADAPLTLDDIRWTEGLAGTYEADCTDGYYELLGRVFTAARAHIESTPEGRREKALGDEAGRLSEILDIPPREIRNCYDAISAAAAEGADERTEAITLYSDVLGKNRGDVSYIERSMKDADPGPRRLDPFYDKLERIKSTPLDELTQEELAYFINAEGEHNLNPLIGWLRSDREDFDRHEATIAKWKPQLQKVGTEVAKKLLQEKPVDQWGLPRIKGFTADEVEAHLQYEQHERLCACLQKDGVCSTYGDNWRATMSVANVHAVFQAMTEMAEKRAARSEARYGVS